jgi:hypothetical protein
MNFKLFTGSNLVVDLALKEETHTRSSLNMDILHLTLCLLHTLSHATLRESGAEEWGK